MKALIAQLEDADAPKLHALVISQLRGENPSGLRQIYEATHYPISAVYSSLRPSVRESLQQVVYALMRDAVSGLKPVVPHEELFALVDPVFSSSALEGNVRSLLLNTAKDLDSRPALRQPILLALVRSGYRGSAAFWRPHLRGNDDDALAVILSGIARASVSEFLSLVAEIKWSPYVADCVSMLTPWLVEEYGAEAVLPRLLTIVRDIDADVRRPVIAAIRPADVPLPRSIIDWIVAIESYAMGIAGDRPWEIFGIDTSSRVDRVAADKGEFQRAIDEWIERWAPHPSGFARAMREIELLRRYPSRPVVVAIIGALDAFRLAHATKEHASFISTAMSVITLNQAIVRLVWHEEQKTRSVYERWLDYAFEVDWLREVVLHDLVKWLDLPDLAPFYSLVAHGQMTIAELIVFARKEAADESVVIRMIHEVYQLAQLYGRPEIVKGVEEVDETFVRKFMEIQSQSTTTPQAMSIYVNGKISELPQ